MPTLVLGRSFLPRYAELQGPVRRKVDDLIFRFPQATHAGIHLEKPDAAADRRARTVRVDQFWRGIVIAPSEGDKFVLYDVLPHDDAYAWCERNTFGVNAATGALEVQDVRALEALERSVGPSEPGREPLFAHLPDKDLLALGMRPLAEQEPSEPACPSRPRVRPLRPPSSLRPFVFCSPRRCPVVRRPSVVAVACVACVDARRCRPLPVGFRLGRGFSPWCRRPTRAAEDSNPERTVFMAEAASSMS